jgi:hypothetical protein
MAVGVAMMFASIFTFLVMISKRNNDSHAPALVHWSLAALFSDRYLNACGVYYKRLTLKLLFQGLRVGIYGAIFHILITLGLAIYNGQI